MAAGPVIAVTSCTLCANRFCRPATETMEQLSGSTAFAAGDSTFATCDFSGVTSEHMLPADKQAYVEKVEQRITIAGVDPVLRNELLPALEYNCTTSRDISMYPALDPGDEADDGKEWHVQGEDVEKALPNRWFESELTNLQFLKCGFIQFGSEGESKGRDSLPLRQRTPPRAHARRRRRKR